MYNYKIYLVVIAIFAIIFLVPLIVVGPTAFYDKSKQVTAASSDIRVETVSNYKSGIIIDKDSINSTITIKRNIWRHNKGYSWEVNKIRVTKYEYNLVSLGDTIK